MHGDEHNKILIPCLNGYICVLLEKIIHVQSNGNSCTFFLADKSTIASSHNLGYFESRLVEGDFMRVHESHIINFRHINRYVKGDGGILQMDDGSEVDVARRHKHDLVKELVRRWGCPAQ
ncbi:MAG: LytTR family transcriptional regulator, partial [Bacteroidia bacterium]|nr:LytTR family transcriptional regulator [Bacteroidia bacterium]